MATAAAQILRLARRGVDVRGVHAHIRRPFRFWLCGDPELVANLRALFLAGHPGDAIPLDAAACLETLDARSVLPAKDSDTRAVIFLGRRGDLTGAPLHALRALHVPILALIIDAEATPSGPAAAPAPGTWGEYVAPTLTREDLRGRFFLHLVDCAKGCEIAVGRRLPVLRETVAAKLTRDAANNSLKVALASAVVDHVPLVGLVLGAVASAGDMVAITGIQILLLVQIEATYGHDPDIQRIWQLLPVIGGGFGWRTLARELVGFIPVAGIPIKGAVAYAGTLVVGEGVVFFMEHGRHMTKAQAATIYARTKSDALRFAREFIARFRP